MYSFKILNLLDFDSKTRIENVPNHYCDFEEEGNGAAENCGKWKSENLQQTNVLTYTSYKSEPDHLKCSEHKKFNQIVKPMAKYFSCFTRSNEKNRFLPQTHNKQFNDLPVLRTKQLGRNIISKDKKHFSSIDVTSLCKLQDKSSLHVEYTTLEPTATCVDKESSESNEKSKENDNFDQISNFSGEELDVGKFLQNKGTSVSAINLESEDGNIESSVLTGIIRLLSITYGNFQINNINYEGH